MYVCVGDEYDTCVCVYMDPVCFLGRKKKKALLGRQTFKNGVYGRE